MNKKWQLQLLWKIITFFFSNCFGRKDYAIVFRPKAVPLNCSKDLMIIAGEKGRRAFWRGQKIVFLLILDVGFRKVLDLPLLVLVSPWETIWVWVSHGYFVVLLLLWVIAIEIQISGLSMLPEYWVTRQASEVSWVSVSSSIDTSIGYLLDPYISSSSNTGEASIATEIIELYTKL